MLLQLHCTKLSEIVGYTFCLFIILRFVNHHCKLKIT